MGVAWDVRGIAWDLRGICVELHLLHIQPWPLSDMSSFSVDTLLGLRPWPAFLEPFTLVYPPNPDSTKASTHASGKTNPKTHTQAHHAPSKAPIPPPPAIPAWRQDRLKDTLKHADVSFSATKDAAPAGPAEALATQLTAILNRLSRSNVVKLSQEVLRIPHLLSEPGVHAAVGVLFDKALADDAAFHDVYAQLCAILAGPLGQRRLDLRGALLKRCQATFEDAAASEDRLLANISFVGHLFRAKLAPPGVVTVCADRLFTMAEGGDGVGVGGGVGGDLGCRVDTERAVDMLCSLLRTVGPTLTGGQPLFDRLAALSGRLKPRLRFMVMDLLELRAKEEWVV